MRSPRVSAPRRLASLITVACLLTCLAPIASALPPAGAATVYLRMDCSTLSAPLQPYCFGGSNAWADLDAWIGAHSGLPPGRNPGPTNPLFVDVGEGTFHGGYTCFDNWEAPTFTRGWVTFQGAGRTKSTLYGSVLSNTCTQIAFRDLSFDGAPPFHTELLVSRGSTVWDRIDVKGSWYEEFGCGALPPTYPPGSPVPKHVWTDSTIVTERTELNYTDFDNNALRDQGIAYAADCDATVFYGGSITLLVGSAVANNPPSNVARYAAVAVADTGSFKGYGTRIEARATASRANPVNSTFGDVGLPGVFVDLWGALGITDSTGGEFELYGGEIVVDSTLVAGQNAAAIYSYNAGEVEVTGATYTVTQQSSQIGRRLAGAGHFDAPLLRESQTCSADPWAPTQSPGALASLDGQDAFIEPGCDTSGVCGGGAGTQQHFMVYRASCGSANPWFDQTAGHCRTSNPSASQADDDADGVPNVADNCVCRANPPITPLAFQHVTGGQLDDDLDGYGNRCDADFDNDGDVDETDHSNFSASMGKPRSGANCGTPGNLPCPPFDLDGVSSSISSMDLNLFRASGPQPGPKCALCPLP